MIQGFSCVRNVGAESNLLRWFYSEIGGVASFARVNFCSRKKYSRRLPLGGVPPVCTTMMLGNRAVVLRAIAVLSISAAAAVALLRRWKCVREASCARRLVQSDTRIVLVIDIGSSSVRCSAYTMGSSPSRLPGCAIQIKDMVVNQDNGTADAHKVMALVDSAVDQCFRWGPYFGNLQGTWFSTSLRSPPRTQLICMLSSNRISISLSNLVGPPDHERDAMCEPSFFPCEVLYIGPKDNPDGVMAFAGIYVIRSQYHSSLKPDRHRERWTHDTTFFDM